tara:strand:+ start:697 stop:912 length:216 start_codon:yes stop_codon:yes gene_type:complete
MSSIGQIILIDHSGKPTVWPIQKSTICDDDHLLQMFENAKQMCAYELAMGGTLKLFNTLGELIKEQRGCVA